MVIKWSRFPVDASTDPPVVGEAVVLWEKPNLDRYDVARDGRFLAAISGGDSGGPLQVNVALNWFQDLQHLMQPEGRR